MSYEELYSIRCVKLTEIRICDGFKEIVVFLHICQCFWVESFLQVNHNLTWFDQEPSAHSLLIAIQQLYTFLFVGIFYVTEYKAYAEIIPSPMVISFDLEDLLSREFLEIFKFLFLSQICGKSETWLGNFRTQLNFRVVSLH